MAGKKGLGIAGVFEDCVVEDSDLISRLGESFCGSAEQDEFCCLQPLTRLFFLNDLSHARA